jgi:hypothetical protein
MPGPARGRGGRPGAGGSFGHWPAADQPHIRDGVMEGATRPRHDLRGAVTGAAGNAVDAGVSRVSARAMAGTMMVSRRAVVLQAMILAETLQTTHMPSGVRLPRASIATVALPSMAGGPYTHPGKAWPISLATNATFIRRTSSARS